MISFVAALEPLRLANRIAGEQLYNWRLFSHDGKPVASSSGLEISVDAPFSDADRLSAAIVATGDNVSTGDYSKLISALRKSSSFGASIGAVCTGTYVLAKAGLLNKHRATIHWENHSSTVAEFPDLSITQELFEIDDKRFTCAGGTAAIDMMLAIIAREQGGKLVTEVTDQLIHHRMRDPQDRQRMDLRSRLGIAHPKLLAVIARMEETIEAPVSLTELARHAQLSSRQLERLFSKYLGHSPTRHYLSIRLGHARFLLRQTSMPILSVAMASGFVSASHFSKSYNEHFLRTPSAERRRPIT